MCNRSFCCDGTACRGWMARRRSQRIPNIMLLSNPGLPLIPLMLHFCEKSAVHQGWPRASRPKGLPSKFHYSLILLNIPEGCKNQLLVTQSHVHPRTLFGMEQVLIHSKAEASSDNPYKALPNLVVVKTVTGGPSVPFDAQIGTLLVVLTRTTTPCFRVA